MVDEALTNTASSNHRRTLSRGKPDVVNWNPEEPHLTPAGPVPSGQEYFGNRNYRLSSSLGKFGELGVTENSNALGMDLNPAPAPAPTPAPMPTPPQPVMTTVPNATRPSVLDLARGIAGSKRASDLPLYNRASIYNPTSLQQPNFGRPSLDSQSGSGTGTGPKVSPFADKFAVEGKYEPDLEDPAVMASVASAQAPRPPRPARPEGLELDEASATDASASTPTPPARPQRNSISNPGPVPTVGHTRKISGPIPFKPQSPPARARQQQRSVALFPSWALVNSDGRYPAITVQTPTTASVISVSSPTGSMAGVGAGRVVSSQPGRQIYPAAALPPQRQPSLKSKRVSVAQSERGMSAAAIQAARAQSPPTVRSPPPPVRSPPPGAMRAQSPPAVVARAQSPPAILTRAQSPPVVAALVQSPPPTVSHQPSRSVDAPPPRPPRAVGPRAKPVTPPSATETPDAPIVTLPLTPPRRIWAEPDVPTTPTTPALSNFPTPPRTVKNVVASSSSSMAGSTGHQLQGSGSSVASRTSTMITAGETAFSPGPTTAATTAFPEIELNGPTPVASPQVKGRALQPPPPISTGLHASPSSYGVSSAPNGLSPITASPQSVHHPQIPTPLASSTLGSPTTLAQFGQAMLPGGGGITRDSSVKTTYTASTASENMHNAFRRELMQGLPSAVGMAHNVAGPSSPTYFPESVSNYHPPVPQLPLPGTFAPHVPRPAVDSWGMAPSIYDASSVNGAGKHVSIAPSYLSANSGRRLSEGTTSGDAEWKELERQLAATGGDVAHIMPRNNATM
ncbi:hypothetical protein FS837_003501 [Tulasnella sp. UAMH 9824]|nr:hypothetical protein FS837_003501 [Tulasnella sp. UAMH 9824]